ncbi:MAG: 16S rRNA (cytidine(1402)-2'-O)-methyltransferase [Gemmatimonadota bacterium]|nr:16S rRNA (cytidine(1402)-2'-O)-methyltransferase [Gemmatimonadota bacterium]MDH5803937.1 16S rRNA (cytidine(1402)-2'-O)-methyltransferase [Gemmatimonadota bacterium]
MSGTLYVIGTPLGNLGDFSPRASEVLRSVDLVAAEDTRRTRILLQHIGASSKVVSYHAHSDEKRVEEILGILSSGGTVGLVSDAGTPSISDPGGALVARARESGVEVVVVPGPSSVAAALSVSGFPADRFTFLGFAPKKGKDRTELLDHAAASPWTTVFFESPQRLAALLGDLVTRCGENRRAAVARELTKIHEEVRVGTLADLKAYYSARAPKGEITLVVQSRPEEPAEFDRDLAIKEATELLSEGVSRRDAAHKISEKMNVSRNEAYKLVNEI